MHPRLRAGSPVGHRKKRKTLSTKQKKKKPPVALYRCLCSDCAANPDCDPSTKLPGSGRWVTRKDLAIHSNAEKKRGVANTLLAGLQAPILDLPVPGEFGIIPSSSYRESSPTPPPTPPVTSPPPSPPLDVNISQEVTALLALVKPALDVFKDQSLVFRTKPDRSKVDLSLLNDDEVAYVCALEPSTISNTTVIGYQETLQTSSQWVDDHPVSSITDVRVRLQVRLLRKRIREELMHTKSLLLVEWTHQAKVAELVQSFDATKYFLDSFKLIPPIALIAYLLVASLYLLCGISVEHCAWVLEVLKLMVQQALKKSSDIFTYHTQASFRNDVRGVIDILDLGPKFNAYVSCPSCHQLHGFDPDKPASYPETCTNVELGHVCGTVLRRVRKSRKGSYQKPIREYHHRSMKDYVAHLFSRPDLQSYLYIDPTSRRSGSSDVWDVWEAPFLRDFPGLDGSTPFIRAAVQEGRLLFSLNMDGFNPYGNKEAGKKVSIGGIYMVCLNLPASIRYNLENIYLVGVIPGPKAPSLHQINYYLKPLVDELLQFWDPGVFLSRTFKYIHGWLVRCALVPLVCDLPAARQMAGFTHHSSSHFCSICTQTLGDINNLDPSTWTLRNSSEHREAAEAWRKAPDAKTRSDLLSMQGVRWTELLRLPYWDPIRYTVIDSMHAFYLRLFNHHCRSIWGMSVKVEDGAALAASTFVEPPEEDMRIAQKIFRYGTKTSLQSLSVNVLRQICKELGISHHGKKGAVLDRLLEYRVHQGWFTPKGRLIGDRPMANQSAPIARPTSILVDPEIQTFMKNGKAPLDLILESVDDVDEFYRDAEKSALNRLVKDDLLTLFAHKVQPGLRMDVALVLKLSKDELRDYIQTQRQKDGMIDETGRPFSKPVPVKKTVVLGREVLAEVRRDLRRLNFPSWMTRPPNHPGEDTWGKFSADQWKTFCTYVLPVTLIRLWGSKDEASIERRQLDNFMHLVSAVKIATSRKMTESRIADYERHMLAYLRTLQDLYPDVKITPYQHLSLHFGALLQGFGPTHAWRCFPFERYNYVMQNMPTNAKFGEMEVTLFHKFSCAQRLRSLFVVDALRLPAALQPLVDAFNRRFRNDGRGTYLNDLLAHSGVFSEPEDTASTTQKTESLSPTVRRLLANWLQENDSLMDDIPLSTQPRVTRCPQIDRHGHKFVVGEDSLADSHILLGRADQSGWRAGSIQQMFSHTRSRADGSTITQTFAVVALYKQIKPRDPLNAVHSRYPIAGGKLFLNEYEKNTILVESSAIEAHVAFCVVPQTATAEYITALPLDKH